MTAGVRLPITRVKVCCIQDADEARLAIAMGASALGLVSAMPSGPGPIADTQIAAIAARVPPPISTFLLTCLDDADAIIAQQRACGTNTLQLVDAVEPGVYSRLRLALPGIALVQVVHVIDEGSVEYACSVAPAVDALLLDSGNPRLAVKELGGTGRRHDWSLSRRIVQSAGKPVFLAGGLNPGNAREAIDAVQPFGLDLCTGLRTDGVLDPRKLEQFMAAVHA